MKNGKRILSVTIKKMVHESLDTGYLGEYSKRPTSEYSIDREHALDCISQEYNHPTSNAVDVKVTASHGPYERNEQLKFLRTSCVVPRNAVHVRNGQYKIWSYDIKFD